MPDKPLEPIDAAMHSIPTVDERPIFSKQYSFPPAHKEKITKQVNELLKNKMIKHSQSPYNTTVFIVPKKLKRKWIMALDFRKLNEKTIRDSYPLPNIIDILDQLGNARYFSVFD